MSVSFQPKCFFPHCTPHKCQFLGLTITEQAYQHYRGACPPCSGLPGKCACNGYACEQIRTLFPQYWAWTGVSSIVEWAVHPNLLHAQCTLTTVTCYLTWTYKHVMRHLEIVVSSQIHALWPVCMLLWHMHCSIDNYICIYPFADVFIYLSATCGTLMMHFANDMFICMCQCDACPLILYVFTCLLQWHYIC